jgi:predicted dehydrogenase
VSASALASLLRSPASAGFPANETINVGAIGCGGRFGHLFDSLTKIPAVRLVAVCDVYDEHRDRAVKLADPKAFVTSRSEELFERSDVDAVMICTPDHWHTPLLVEAMKRGKHAYCEKPLTHDLSEGPTLRAAASGSKSIVQIGQQQRSMPHIAKARELVAAGRLGETHKVRLNWNRNQARDVRSSVNVDPKSVDWKRFLGSAPAREFDPFRFRHWRWFWDFGGGILTDLMVHWMDVANWLLDLGAPSRAVALGANHQTKGLWETPDTIQTIVEYDGKNTELYFEGTFVNADKGASIEILGRKANLYVDRGRFELTPEGATAPAESMILGSGKKGADFYENPNGELLHLADWIGAIRAGKPASVGVEAGIQAVWAAHLGNRAFRTVSLAEWNGEK